MKILYVFYLLCRLQFTSSDPVRTTEVFALAISLCVAHSSVCLALKKLTCGSADWRISLREQNKQ